MYGIEILKAEHENILHFTDVLEEKMLGILNGKEVDVDYLKRATNFMREYADGHHHQKEEDYLFKIMIKEIGSVAEKIITTGMLVEHDQIRLTVSELIIAINDYKKTSDDLSKLNIIGYTMSYIYQIRRHIEKEDEAIFGFANRMLSDESKKWVDHHTRRIEEDTDKITKKFKDFIKQ